MLGTRPAPVIWVVSTVKDSLANLERFVTQNLAGGADHLVVFVDDDDPDLMEFLASHPHTTGVAAGAWWGDARPPALNSRQRIAANVVRSLAARLRGVRWVFHIDGDEVIRVDPRRLDALDAEVVRLEVLEAVASWDPAPEHRHLFKHQLDKGQLAELVARGAISRPKNSCYFHGHLSGKVGIRPAHDVWFGIHRAMDARREPVSATAAPWLRLLHYESVSGPEFVRKWSNLLSSGTEAAVRSSRAEVAAAILAEMGTPQPRWRRVFEQTTADHIETLLTLGLLTTVDPDRSVHTPTKYPDTGALESSQLALTVEDKRIFEPERDPGELQRLLDRLGV